MFRGLLKLLNPEIGIGFLLASLFWIAVLGWQAAYTPPEIDKQKCYESAEKQGRKSEECKTMWERTTSDPVAFFTFWLVVFTGGLGVSTVMLWLAGEKQIEFLRESAASQGRDMQASISESIRAATAMEGVAQGIDLSVKATEANIETIRERTALQMRAYISVLINTGVYQEKDKNFKFDVRPVVINTGNTPAHKFTYWASARILPHPVPPDFDFPEGEDSLKAGFVLGPHQNIVINAMVPDFVDDAEVDEIKRGINRRACVWGIVFYEDVFGEPHRTRFCHNIHFYVGANGTEMVSGNYSAQHNDAD
jgi:hypothetical protein